MRPREGSKQRLNMALALLPVDATQVEYLYTRLLTAEPNEVPVIREALAPHKDALVDRLWAIVEMPAEADGQKRLRAAAALAEYDPEEPALAQGQRPDRGRPGLRKPGLPGVVERGVSSGQDPSAGAARGRFPATASGKNRRTNPGHEPLGRLRRRPTPGARRSGHGRRPEAIRRHLRETQGAWRRGTAVVRKANSDKKPLPGATEAAMETLARRQANAAVALLKMNHAAKVWPLLKTSARSSAFAAI